MSMLWAGGAVIYIDRVWMLLQFKVCLFMIEALHQYINYNIFIRASMHLCYTGRLLALMKRGNGHLVVLHQLID